MDFKHTDITELIIKAFYKVYNTLGYGFLEKIYGNALAIELRNLGLEVIQEARIVVYYDGQAVGEYFADLLVAGVVIVELKAVKKLLEEHEAQLLNVPESYTPRDRPVAQLWPRAQDQTQGIR